MTRLDNGSGAPLPSWAQGENFVAPQDVTTVVYPGGERVTDAQLGADTALGQNPQPGDGVSAHDGLLGNPDFTDVDQPIDESSAADSEPPVVESQSDSAA